MSSRAKRGSRVVPRRLYRGPGAVDTVGVDVGGVIVDRVAEGSDTSFFADRYLDTPAVPGAFEGLGVLSQHFEGRLYIISKAGPRIAAKTRHWLRHHGVFADGGILEDRLHFVSDRREKATLCRRFEITHFIDDRLDVLLNLDSVDHRYLFTGGLGLHQPPKLVPAEILVASTWPTLLTFIRFGRMP